MNRWASGVWLVAAALGGVCVLSLNRWTNVDESDSESSPGEDIGGDFRDVPNWMSELDSPTNIRVVLTDPDRPAPSEPLKDESMIALSIDHLGRLEGKDLKFVEDMFQSIRQSRVGKLKKYTVVRSDSASVLREAGLLAKEAEGESLLVALKKGWYLIEKQTSVRRVPDANVLNMGCRKDGQDCVITVIMPHKEFPNLKAAVDYRKEVERYRLTEVARLFNGKPHEDRKALVDRLDRVRKSRGRSSADTRWSMKQFPKGLKVNRERMTLVLARPGS